MADSGRFDFCPKCGALARDGVCQSCGYQIPEIVKETEAQQQQPVPPPQPQKKSGKATVIVCVVLGLILAALVALILAGVYMIQNSDKDRGNSGFEKEQERKEKVLEDAEEELDIPEESGNSEEKKGTYSYYENDVTDDNRQESGQDTSLPYYSGPYNALKDDLSYEIGFTESIFYSSGNDSVYIEIEYPQIVSGDVKNKRQINEALYYEYEYYLNFFEEEFKPLMNSDTDYYYCQSDSFVTYMDEKILSVVFYEKLDLMLQGDSFRAINFYCMNFDLETGALLENTDLLHMDEAFAIDFRQREAAENGEEALTHYTDQEILEMLKDGGTLVIFYTPMGMEVGLNLEDRVVYVTYEDYEDFRNHF